MTEQPNDYFVNYIESQDFKTISDMLDFADVQYAAYEQAAASKDTQETDDKFVNWAITATYLFPYFQGYIRAVVALRKEYDEKQKELADGTESN